MLARAPAEAERQCGSGSRAAGQDVAAAMCPRHCFLHCYCADCGCRDDTANRARCQQPVQPPAAIRAMPISLGWGAAFAAVPVPPDAMPTEHIETLIIGAGQSGLAMSHMLKRRGPSAPRAGAAADRRTLAHANDGMVCNSSFPTGPCVCRSFAFPHTDPDGFATSGEIVDYIAAYADFVGAPVRCGVEVTALRPRNGDRFPRRDTGRIVRSLECRRRHRSVSASGFSGGDARVMPQSFRCTRAATRNPISFRRARF